MAYIFVFEFASLFVGYRLVFTGCLLLIFIALGGLGYFMLQPVVRLFVFVVIVGF